MSNWLELVANDGGVHVTHTYPSELGVEELALRQLDIYNRVVALEAKVEQLLELFKGLPHT